MSSQLAIVGIGEKSSGLGVTRKERRRVGVISERRDPHNRERDSKTSRGLLGLGGTWCSLGTHGTEEESALVTFLDMSCSLSFVILSSYCFSLSNTFYAYSVSVQLDAGCSRTGIFFFFWSVLYTSASLAFRISARLRGKGNINLF